MVGCRDPPRWSSSETELADTLAAVAACGTESPSSSSGSPHQARPPRPRANRGATDTGSWWANQTWRTTRDAKRRLGSRTPWPRPRAGPGRDGRRHRLRGAGRGDRHGRRRGAGRAPPVGRDPPDPVGQAARSRIGARDGVIATARGGELPRSVGVTTANRTRPIASHGEPALSTMCSPWEAQVRLHTVVKRQPRLENPGHSPAQPIPPRPDNAPPRTVGSWP